MIISMPYLLFRTADEALPKSREDKKKMPFRHFGATMIKFLTTILTTNVAIIGQFAHELTRAIVMNYRCDAARCRDGLTIPPSVLRPYRLLSCVMRGRMVARSTFIIYTNRARRACRSSLIRRKTSRLTRLYSPSGPSIKWRKRRFPEKKRETAGRRRKFVTISIIVDRVVVACREMRRALRG